MAGLAAQQEPELPGSSQSGVGQAGWRARYYCYYFCYYFYFFSVSGSADPQMLLMEIRPVYMLISSPLTSGLLFS